MKKIRRRFSCYHIDLFLTTITFLSLFLIFDKFSFVSTRVYSIWWSIFEFCYILCWFFTQFLFFSSIYTTLHNATVLFTLRTIYYIIFFLCYSCGFCWFYFILQILLSITLPCNSYSSHYSTLQFYFIFNVFLCVLSLFCFQNVFRVFILCYLIISFDLMIFFYFYNYPELYIRDTTTILRRIVSVHSSM